MKFRATSCIPSSICAHREQGLTTQIAAQIEDFKARLGASSGVSLRLSFWLLLLCSSLSSSPPALPPPLLSSSSSFCYSLLPRLLQAIPYVDKKSERRMDDVVMGSALRFAASQKRTEFLGVYGLREITRCFIGYV